MKKSKFSLENIFYFVLKFMYWYSFIVSVLFLICYYFDVDFMLKILSVLLVLDCILECFKGKYFHLVILIISLILKVASPFLLLAIINIVIFILQQLIWKLLYILINKFK